MIGLDTNILVRLLIEDDPVQTPLVFRLLGEALASNEVCYVSDVALCELEWVLVSSYDASRSEVASAFQRLFDQPGFLFDDPQSLRRALNRYRLSRVEFSDLLLGGRGQACGVRTTYTFDRPLSRQDGFSLLS